MPDSSVDPPKAVTIAGQPQTTGVGTVSIREAIEKYRPLLGLHGHIHEARVSRILDELSAPTPGGSDPDLAIHLGPSAHSFQYGN